MARALQLSVVCEGQAAGLLQEALDPAPPDVVLEGQYGRSGLGTGGRERHGLLEELAGYVHFGLHGT